MAMVPSPLAFLEVKKKSILLNATEFGHPEFSKTPEAFNAIDVVLATDKFVLMVMHPVVLIAAGHEAIVSLPAVSVDVAVGEHMASDYWHQLSFGAVFDHAHKNSLSSLVEPDHRRFPSRTSTSFSPDPFRPEIGLINFNLPCKWPRFFHGQCHNPASEQAVDALHRLPSHV